MTAVVDGQERPNPDHTTTATAVKTPKKVSRMDWAIILLLTAFFTLNFADKSAIGLAAPEIKKDLGITASGYGLIASSFFWLFAVGAIVLALAFRRIGWRWSAAGLMIAWVLSMLPLVAPTTLTVLVISRVALGFFEGPTQALCQSIVADRFSTEKRAFAGAVVNSGTSLGPLIAAPVLTWVILTWSWHAAFIGLIIVGVIWLVAWLIITRKIPGMGRQDRAASTDVTVADQPADPNGDINVPFVSTIKLASFWGLSLISFAGYLISALKIAWLPSFLEEGMGYEKSTVGLLVTLPYAFAVVTLLIAGFASGWMLRKGRSIRAARTYLSVALLLVGSAAMIGFALVPAGGVQLVLVLVAFSMSSVVFVTAFAGAADFLPRKHRAGFFGCVIALYSLAGVFAPLVLGMIVDAGPTPAEGFSNGFLVVGIAIGVAAIAGGFLLDPEKSRRLLLEETARRSAAQPADQEASV